MYHDPSIVNNNGWTIAMLCIIYNREIEPWMRHDPSIVNNNGNTIAMICLSFKRDIEPWMYID